MHVKGLRTIFVFLSLFLVSGCALEDNWGGASLPDVPVYLELDLYGRDAMLNEPMALFVYDREKYAGERLGHGGIVIAHVFDDEYYAYDLLCPYDYPSRSRLIPHVDMPLCVYCPSCGSVYDLGHFGTPVRGSVSRIPLQRYYTELYDDGRLIVSN